MAVSGTAAALERRLRKRIIVLWTRAGDSDVDVLAARLESRRFSCVTARRILVGVCPPPPPQKVKASVQIRRPKNFSLLFLLFLLFLLLLFDIFQKTKDKERTKESKSFWKTRERQTFSRRLFLFCPSFVPSQKKSSKSKHL